MKRTTTTRFCTILAIIYILTPCFSIDYNNVTGATEETEITEYVILTDFPETSPEYTSIIKLQEFRDASIIHFSGDVFAALTPLRDAQPTHVAVVTSPDRMDESFAYNVFMLAKQMDDNFDTDFAYGFITGNSAAEIDDYIDRVIEFDTGLIEMPREFRSLWRTGDGAFGGGIGNWGDRLTDLMVWYYDYAGCNAFRINTDSTDKSLVMEEVAQTGIIHILLHGAVTMTEAFNYSEIPHYQHPVMVFNNGCYGGCTSKFYSQCIPTPPSGLYEDRAQTVNPEESFALNYLKNGAIAYYGHMCMWGKNIWPQNLTESLLSDLSRSTGEILTDWYNIPGSENIVTAEDTVGPQANDLFGIDLNRFDYSAIVLYGDPAVTIKNLNMPPMIDYLPDSIEFCSGSQYQLNMDQYAEDLNDPVSTLEWEFTGTDSIGLDYDSENRILEITAVNNEISTDTIFMKVSDPGGAFCRDTLLVLVNTAPDHPGAIQGVTETCENSSETYSISPVSGATSYTWTLPSGWSGSSITTSITVTTAATSGTISVRADNSCGSSNNQTLSITASPIPSAPVLDLITHPTCELATGSVVLNGLPDPWIITVNPGGSQYSGSGASTTISSLVAGTYTFVVTNSGGCTSSPTVEVVINANPSTTSAPQVGTITQPTCNVATGSVILEGLPETGTWSLAGDPGDITLTGSGSGTTVAELAPGTYTFIVTNAEGCSSASSAEVTIDPQPVTPSAPVVGTITQPTCDVATGSVILEGLPSSGTWTLTQYPEASTITNLGTSCTIDELDAGAYTYTVTNESSCTSDESTEIVIDEQPPTPPTPTIILNGNTLHSDAPEGNQWYNQDGVIEGATDQDYTVEAEGEYYVIVTLQGCSSESSNVIYVIPIGFEEMMFNNSIRIYPNPVTDELTIIIDGSNERISVEIYNSLGESVYNDQFKVMTTVQTENLTAGIYVIRLWNKETYVMRKVIKK